MAPVTIGLLHPGEMGAAVGAVLRGRGHPVLWAAAGRSPESRTRGAGEQAEADAGPPKGSVRATGVSLPFPRPPAPPGVAGAAAGFGGVSVDANAISPPTAREVEAALGTGGGTCVDGGIIGPP